MPVREERARGEQERVDGLARAARLARLARAETEHGVALPAVAWAARVAAQERAASVEVPAVRLATAARERAVSAASGARPAPVETGALAAAPAQPAVDQVESRA